MLIKEKTIKAWARLALEKNLKPTTMQVYLHYMIYHFWFEMHVHADSNCISVLPSLIWKNWKDCMNQRTSSSQIFWIFTFICMLFIDCSIHSLNRLHVFKSSILTGRRDCNRWTPSLLHGPRSPLVWGRLGQWWLWRNRGTFTWKAKPSRRNSKSTFISFIILIIFLGLLLFYVVHEYFNCHIKGRTSLEFHSYILIDVLTFDVFKINWKKGSCLRKPSLNYRYWIHDLCRIKFPRLKVTERYQ